MTLTGVTAGDVVLVDKRGRIFYALVDEKLKGELKIKPITPNINYFSATASEVKAHWKKRK